MKRPQLSGVAKFYMAEHCDQRKGEISATTKLNTWPGIAINIRPERFNDKADGELFMKKRILAAILAVGGLGLGWNTPVHAIGCISGGVAGAVAGHMAHHGILGAIGGCVAGHELHKHQQRAATQSQNDKSYQTDQTDQNGNSR